MSKTARDCASPRAGNGQYLAILPWRSEPALAQEAIPSRLLLVSGVAPVKTNDCVITPRSRNTRGAQCASRGVKLAADTKLLDQFLVTDFVGAPQIIEQLTALAYELEQSAPRMVILGVGLEVHSKAVRLLIRSEKIATCTSGEPVSPGFLANCFITSALRPDVTDIGHPLVAPRLPISPARLNTRLGTISPRSSSASATSWPAAVT